MHNAALTYNLLNEGAFLDDSPKSEPDPVSPVAKTTPCAKMAPSFPQAAVIPYAVDRYRVGNASPGTMKLVVFGPKFWKKLAKQ